jgi:tRNA-modifying protein YgfZ
MMNTDFSTSGASASQKTNTGSTKASEAPASQAPNTDLSAASGHLPHLGVLRFAGPDALSFLQGQLSNDTRRLSAGAPLLAAYSSPQGRVVALLHLLPHSSGVIALLPREIVPLSLERLRKYVLRAKVKIEDVSEQLSVVGLHGTTALESGGLTVPDSAQGYVEQNGIGIGRIGAGSSRFWLIGEAADLARHGIAADTGVAPRVEHDWRLADIRAGLPQVYAATREMFVAQMLNLDLIDGISFTKGCFTGQEIIARTQHLGRIKRRLFRLRLPMGAWAIGQAVRLTDGRSGRLTELAEAGDAFEALAVLNIAASETSVDAVDAESTPSTLIGAAELPLPYSLV